MSNNTAMKLELKMLVRNCKLSRKDMEQLSRLYNQDLDDVCDKILEIREDIDSVLTFKPSNDFEQAALYCEINDNNLFDFCERYDLELDEIVEYINEKIYSNDSSTPSPMNSIATPLVLALISTPFLTSIFNLFESIL